MKSAISIFKVVFPLLLPAFFIFFGTIQTAAAQGALEEETFEMREAFDHMQIFDGAIEVGRTHTKMYLGGDGITQLEFKAFDESKSPVEAAWSASDQWYILDFLQEPIIDLTYQGEIIRLVVKLIQVDWPGNEINWRMIPEVTIISEN